MKVFISWSGETSLKVAKILKDWIPCVIQGIEPYFSTEDIDKGARWGSDIAKELSDANFGILCITKENIESAWLNFEAGALSKSMDSAKVCPFLFGLKPSDVSNSPILQFQMTNFERDDVYKLFHSMNKSLDDNALEDARLDKMFNLSWPIISKELESIEGNITESPKKKTTVQNEVMDEVLELLRSQQIILRNPEKLLPIEYIETVFNNRNSINSKMSRRMSHFLRTWCNVRDRLYYETDLSNDRTIISRLRDFINTTQDIFYELGLSNEITPSRYVVADKIESPQG